MWKLRKIIFLLILLCERVCNSLYWHKPDKENPVFIPFEFFFSMGLPKSVKNYYLMLMLCYVDDTILGQFDQWECLAKKCEYD